MMTGATHTGKARKQGKKNRKYNRNRVKCAAYRARHQDDGKHVHRTRKIAEPAQSAPSYWSVRVDGRPVFETINYRRAVQRQESTPNAILIGVR
jgi:hypothetical protein